MSAKSSSKSVFSVPMLQGTILFILVSIAFVSGLLIARINVDNDTKATTARYDLPHEADGYDVLMYLGSNPQQVELEYRGFFDGKPETWAARNLMEQFAKLDSIADEALFTFDTVPCLENHSIDIYVGNIYTNGENQNICFEKIRRHSIVDVEEQFGAVILTQTNMTSAFEIVLVSKESWPIEYRYDGKTGNMDVVGGPNMDITFGRDLNRLVYKDSHHTYKQVIQSLPITQAEWNDLAPYFQIIQWHE